MHGGIGRSINSVEQIEKLERPIIMDAMSIILMDLLWSDPTENDGVEGLRPNARGPGLVTFGVWNSSPDEQNRLKAQVFNNSSTPFSKNKQLLYCNICRL
ncbi:serine/threonine-protein phosphatase BSL1 homolog [Rosa rugosa]|uniref:serine/threonine-protein phosphatase BSL1 homolog n=1 Tax=Rosa rugosa TaxID=74645 RepID=UPI002B407E47|nr:serine/threonine-protein phosphatase BSL1 homolog [Rosa rugosa]